MKLNCDLKIYKNCNHFFVDCCDIMLPDSGNPLTNIDVRGLYLLDKHVVSDYSEAVLEHFFIFKGG